VREELRGEAFVDEALDATWEPRSDVFRLSMTKEPACETGRDENGVLAVEPAAEPDFEAKEPAFETGREVSREPAVDPAVDPPEVLSPPFLGPAAAVLPDAAVVLLSTEPLRLTPSPTVVSCLEAARRLSAERMRRTTASASQIFSSLGSSPSPA